MKTLLATALAVSVLAAGSAQASMTCGERSAIVGQLQASYQESHRASGLESDTKMIEIWTSAQSGTWTILVTKASGISCIAAAGKNWLDIAPVVEDTAS